ncbi:hypothetical protein K6Y76_16695 [Burkholderia cenocepacia]|uniref:hypothetical protein n=1 Tax=Burkholderia cenocepacia TaxID=95486 RepID=UPI0018AF62C9|nr:hypothetical protein [Burkholderia cenocepacia]MCG0577991.1 hypothetical protein [Burkholderia cenocepacia]MCW3524449.1 hypothetical protein [Burkholderia cenocepacia]MCW3614671.1 hypothetical protein [Burkholderia cenocepacia]MCW3652609.1 hypothetical protein [Burkholderia cenocepacia]MCW3667581.1 hypothetical protein [Burkholderia cenocepacia]
MPFAFATTEQYSAVAPLAATIDADVTVAGPIDIPTNPEQADFCAVIGNDEEEVSPPHPETMSAVNTPAEAIKNDTESLESIFPTSIDCCSAIK